MHAAGRFRNRSGQARIHREGLRELIDGQTVVDSERDVCAKLTSDQRPFVSARAIADDDHAG